MSQDYEHYIAIREGAQIHSSDLYFDARPEVDTTGQRRIFEHGFEAAYDLREKELNALREKCAELQRQLDEAATNLPALIEQALAEEQERIIGILYGIDKTEIEDEKGWWETSFGAKFGLGILDAIRARKP